MMRSVHSGDRTPLNSCPASSWPSWHPVILRHHSGHDDSQVHLLGSRVIGVTICQVRSSRKICLFDVTFSMWDLQTTWVAVTWVDQICTAFSILDIISLKGVTWWQAVTPAPVPMSHPPSRRLPINPSAWPSQWPVQAARLISPSFPPPLPCPLNSKHG